MMALPEDSRTISFCAFLKGQCYEIFELGFFLSNYPTWAPDSRVKAFLQMASNSRSDSTKSVLQRIQLYKLGSKSYFTSVVNDTAGSGELEFERLWLPLKGISIKKKLHRQIALPIAITITHKI
jgi:hypothetical protein